MGIPRNAASDFINEPGEYRVKVTLVIQGESKSGKPMTTIQFNRSNGQGIKAFFLTDEPWARKTLYTLKEAAGLPDPKESPVEDLSDKEVGILVEAQPPDPSGKVYMRINGYGPADAVTEAPAGYHTEVPF